MKFDLHKFLKNREIYCKKMAPKGIIGYLWIIALGVGGLFLDLQSVFGLYFQYVLGFVGFIFLFSFGYTFAWVFYLFYYAISSHIYAKKFPEYKEVLLNEDK